MVLRSGGARLLRRPGPRQRRRAAILPAFTRGVRDLDGQTQQPRGVPSTLQRRGDLLRRSDRRGAEEQDSQGVAHAGE